MVCHNRLGCLRNIAGIHPNIYKDGQRWIPAKGLQE